MKNLDLFGKQVSFQVAGKRTFGTSVGGILSVLIILYGTFFIIYFSYLILSRKNQSLIVTDYNDNFPKRLNLSEKNFTLAFGLQYPNYTMFLDESIFTVKATLKTMTRKRNSEEVITQTKLNLVRCSDFKFTVIPEYFELMDLKNLYCLEMDENVYIEGAFGQELWSYISLDFFKCDAQVSNCKSEEEIKNRLLGGYVGMFATDKSIIPKNYKNPSHTFGKNLFTSFSINTYLDFWVYIKHIDIVTEDGLLFKTKKTISEYGFEETRETTDSRENVNFLSVKFGLTQKRTVYERQYEKIQNIAASAGGIIQVGIIIGESISFLFREVFFKFFVVSCYFTSELMKKNEVVNSMTSKTIKTQLELNESVDGERKDSKDQRIKSSLRYTSSLKGIVTDSELKKLKKLQNKKLKISTLDFLSWLCNSKVKKKVHEVSLCYLQLESKLEFFNYLAIQDDISWLKKLTEKNDKSSIFSSKNLLVVRRSQISNPSIFGTNSHFQPKNFDL